MADQLIFDLPQRQALGRDAFLVTDSNREAVHLIDAYEAWAHPIQLIYGPGGSGKSHLAAVLASQKNALVVNGGAALNDALADVLASNVAVDVVIIDPLMIGDLAQEETLFHMFNHSLNRGAKLLLLSDIPPAQMTIDLPDLQSRIKATPAIALLPPDDALLRGLMRKLFDDRQVEVSGRVIDYILPRIERDYAAIAEMVGLIDRRALELKKPITVPLVAEIMERHITDI